MTASVRAATKASTATNDATLTISKPTGTADGDVLVLLHATASSRYATGISGGGWTKIVDVVWISDYRYTLWMKTASSEGSDYTITLNLAYASSAILVALQGVETPPNYTYDEDSANGSGGTVTADALTVDDDGSIVLAFGLGRRDPSSSMATSGLGQTAVVAITPASNVYYIACESYPHDAGSTGTRNWSYTPTWADTASVVTFAFSPTPTGGVTTRPDYILGS